MATTGNARTSTNVKTHEIHWQTVFAKPRIYAHGIEDAKNVLIVSMRMGTRKRRRRRGEGDAHIFRQNLADHHVRNG